MYYKGRAIEWELAGYYDIQILEKKKNYLAINAYHYPFYA